MKNLLLVMFFFVANAILAQTKISGTILDETGGPLPGASVVEKGTSNGTSTDFDGKFSLNVKSKEGVIIVSFVGYKNNYTTFSKGGSLGTIKLVPDENKLEEIVITATSLAIDRKTPVAVSTLKAEDIERKLGTQEFPEILKSTPGVYATRAGGGFGDGELRLRGFNSANIGVLINGVPVNDMENGRVFWSNWAGLGDVTSLTQVQRGLGASKVAVPSIGGTINIVTKSTDAEKGGNIIASTGNNGYQKYGFTLSTGKMENGLAASVSLSKTSGEGFVDATPFEAYSYFGNLSYEFNDKHTLSLTSFGTPQEHGQRFEKSSIEEYRDAPSGVRYNPDIAVKNGEQFLLSKNFFHKNQTSLNHYWDINDVTTLSTAAYFSVGNGGVTFDHTNTDVPSDLGLFQKRLGNQYDPIDVDAVVEHNQQAVDGSEAILRTSRNNHSWYGVLSTFKTSVNENFDFLAGLDYRHYRGHHYVEVADLLGGDYFRDDADVRDPLKQAEVGDIIFFNNDGVVNWLGGFFQVEYTKESFNAFVSASTSNTGYKRIDYFNHVASDPLRETDTYNFLGYGIKGGANYKIGGVHNVFGNVGYFEKAPFFGTVFEENSNDPERIVEDAETEKVLSFELGYGLRSQKFSANLNLYATQWDDQTESITTPPDPNGERFFATATGVSSLHKGIEFDFEWRPIDRLKVTGMTSLGDWTWDTNIVDQEVRNENQEVVGLVSGTIDGVKVADAAQTTAALGLWYKFWDKTSVTVDYNYFGDLYADFQFETVTNSPPNDETPDITPVDPPDYENTYKIPDYHTFDASLRHGFELGAFDASVTLRVNNILNVEYISDADDSSPSDADATIIGANTNLDVWFGAGRTFSLSAKIKF